MLSVAKITNLDLSNIEQPVIFDMFQDYPQPFTSNDISNSFGNINTSQVKKKKKIVYKKRTSNSAKSLGSQQQKPKKKIGEYEVLNEEQNNKNKRMKKKKDGEGSEDEVSVNGESNNDQTEKQKGLKRGRKPKTENSAVKKVLKESPNKFNVACKTLC